MASFMDRESRGDAVWDQTWFRFLALFVGLGLLYAVSVSRWVDRQLSRIIKWALGKYTSLDLHDYAGLLHMSGGYVVGELRVKDDDWLAGQSLIDLALTKEGVIVLGIEKPNGVYIGAPQGHTRLGVGDLLLLYGRGEQLRALDERHAGASGNWEHDRAVSKQRQIEAVEAKALDASEKARQDRAAVDDVTVELERVRGD